MSKGVDKPRAALCPTVMDLSSPGRRRLLQAGGYAAALSLGLGFATPGRTQQSPLLAPDALLDDLAERTFRYFWETANPVNGLAPDCWPTKSACSIAALGFALTAYPIGVERGLI